MADWFAFLLTIGEETISWLTAMTLFDVPLIGILVGFFCLGVLFRVLLIHS